MKAINMTNAKTQLLLVVTIAVALLLAPAAFAAAPGITGPNFNLTAQAAYITQPDGQMVYSWGYGCNGAPSGFAPQAMGGTCSNMQIPGPTLIVNEGDSVSVTLINKLPVAAGTTSILFPGFQARTTGGVAGLLTQEAANGGSVTYTFTATSPGTRAYYSGTQGDLQIEMGLYGAIIVLPKTPGGATGCTSTNRQVEVAVVEPNLTLSTAAYDHPATCYDREYLFQFSEMDPNIHSMADRQQAAADCSKGPGSQGCSMNVPTEPYHPAYFMINGRSMPDDMDPNYAPEYPHQPYNGNPHMHPGEQVLLRIIGQGRWQHPFHEHANHVRILARDGNLILTPDGKALAGPLLFTTTTTPGLAMDGIFYYTAKGLNWDMYGHHLPTAKAYVSTATETGNVVTIDSGAPLVGAAVTQWATITGVGAGYDGTYQLTGVTQVIDPTTQVNTGTQITYVAGTTGLAAFAATSGSSQPGFVSVVTATAATDPVPCIPDVNGYYTDKSTPPAPYTAINYYEWCQDHNKPLQVHPFGDVAAGGPVTLPDPNLFTNGAWYGGSPYLGPDATTRATGPTGTTPPSGTVANPPSSEAGFAFMWHSHNEREITTNNIFPGGMMMMMLVDSREFPIDESK